MTPAESNDPSTSVPSPYGPSEPQHGLSWLELVKCRICADNSWRVIGGVWTCPCGQQMHDAREQR